MSRVGMWGASLLLPITMLVPESRGAAPTVRAEVGEHTVLYPAGYHELNYFPDEPPSILRRKPLRFLMVVGKRTVLMAGDTWQSAVPLGSAFQPSEGYDNGYAGISSVIADRSGSKLIGFYHAEDHIGMPKVAYSGVQGGYWSIGAAISHDQGKSFSKVGQILRSSIPRDKATSPFQGIGDVCVIRNAGGEYLYAYYTDLTRRPADKRATIAMARSEPGESTRQGSWWKFFDGNFSEPGLGGQESPVVKPLAEFRGEVFQPHVTYLAEWKKYLMVCSVHSFADWDRREEKTPRWSGIYFSVSEDGIHWPEPYPLFNALTNASRGLEYVAHPSLYLERITKTRAEGWLFYCYSARYGGTPPNQPHHFGRRAIVLTKENRRR